MRHDFQLAHNSGLIRGSLLPVIAVTLFCIFVIIAIFNTFVSSRNYEVGIIERDVKHLADILMQIEKDCKIISFEAQQNSINFLNVKSFAGSQVGPINLKHPDRWKGPYLEVNPSVQSYEYMVVRTKSGYYVAPGNGVKLPNGKVIGVDIKLNEDADIDSMVKDNKLLSYKNRALAAQVTIKKRAPYFVSAPSLDYPL